MSQLAGASAGRQVRTAWIRGAGESADIAVTDTGAPGVRILSQVRADWRKPLITADGNSVIATQITGLDDSGAPLAEMHLLPWTGGAGKPLGKGFALTLHTDDQGAEWVYALESLRPSRRSTLTGSMLVRFHAATPEEREIIWADGLISTDNFQVSRDGLRAAGLFPWPRAGLLDLSDPVSRKWLPLGHGSWTALAGDNSYASCLVDGTQRRLKMTAPNAEPGWDFNLQEQSSLGGQPVTSLRWSNHPRFVAMTLGRETESEVWAVHFSDDLRRIERFVRITEDSQMDTDPVMWVKDGASFTTVREQKPASPAPKTLPWPSDSDGLLFAWGNADSPNQIQRVGEKSVCQVKPMGNAVTGRHYSMNLSAGWFSADEASGKIVTDTLRESGAFTLGFILTERSGTRPPYSVRLVTLQRPDGTDLLALHRVDKWLVLRLLLGPDETSAVEHTISLTEFSIRDQEAADLSVSLQRDNLVVRIGPQKIREIQMPATGFGAWRDGRLFFGDPMPYGEPWRGEMERVYLAGRSADDSEIQATAESNSLTLVGRRQAGVASLTGRLIESSEAFPLTKYPGIRSALTSSVWEVTQLNRWGDELLGKRITVLRWAVMDGKPLPPPVLTGDMAEMNLEEFSDHDELSREVIHDTTKQDTVRVFFDPSLPRPAAATYR